MCSECVRGGPGRGVGVFLGDTEMAESTCRVVSELKEGQMAKTNPTVTLKEMPNSTIDKDEGGAYVIDTHCVGTELGPCCWEWCY